MRACVLLACVAAAAAVARATPLDDYVFRPDPTYKWTNHTTIKGPTYDVHNVFLTSQVCKADDGVRAAWWVSRDRKVCHPLVYSHTNGGIYSTHARGLIRLAKCTMTPCVCMCVCGDSFVSFVFLYLCCWFAPGSTRHMTHTTHCTCDCPVDMADRC